MTEEQFIMINEKLDALTKLLDLYIRMSGAGFHCSCEVGNRSEWSDWYCPIHGNQIRSSEDHS